MFHSRYTVDFVDTDAGGVVYHTRYLEMAERARAAMLRHIGLSNKQLLQVNMIFPVTNLTCRFHKPAKLDDTIDIYTKVIEITAARLILQHHLKRDDTLLVALDLTLACVHVNGKPMRLPAFVKDALQPQKELS